MLFNSCREIPSSPVDQLLGIPRKPRFRCTSEGQEESPFALSPTGLVVARLLVTPMSGPDEPNLLSPQFPCYRSHSELPFVGRF
jgi:hypothetical protein